MSEMKTVPSILDVIKSITSNRETGRLEISSAGTHGVLLFTEGKLVDARVESLSGFQAVNAAVALRNLEFRFDHVEPASHAVVITPSERVVLKRFFGIETAEIEEPIDPVEPDPHWNETPEQVVPLAEVEDLPQIELDETPTVEVAAVRSVSIIDERALGNTRQSGYTRKFSFLLRPRVAVFLVLLLALAVGATALRTRIRARQQAAAEVKQQITESQPVPPAQDLSAKSEGHAVNVQDLSGEWRLVNTIEKTAYKSFDKMQVGFRLKINQKGNEFTAKGEKFSENGQTLPASSRTPIQVTGSIDGDKVVATFVEDGKMRRTSGRFVWRVESDGDGLTGTFVSTAANSSGRSSVTKQE